MRAFLFECKKLLKKKTTFVSISLSILAVIGLYLFNYSVVEKINKGNIAFYEINLERFNNFVNDSKEEKEKAIEAGNTAKAEEMDLMIKRYQESSTNYKNLKKSYEKEDWETLYERDMNNLQIFIDDPDGSSIAIEEQLISNFTIRATYEEIKILKENNSKPFIQNTIHENFLPTIYDNFTGSSLEQWESKTKRFGREGFSFLVQLIQMLYIPAVVLIGCFIFGNTISSESTKKRRGINFYKVLPYSNLKIFVAKYLSGYVFLLLFSLLMLAIPLVCSLFTNGLGSLKNPILVYEGSKPNIFGNALNPIDDQFHFIDYQEYFWKILLFVILFSFFMYSIYFLLALFIKNPSLTLILLGAITFIGLNISSSEFNPYIYTDIHKIITRETAALTFNPGVSYSTGLKLYLITGLILSIIGYYKFQFNKQIT